MVDRVSVRQEIITHLPGEGDSARISALGHMPHTDSKRALLSYENGKHHSPSPPLRLSGTAHTQNGHGKPPVSSFMTSPCSLHSEPESLFDIPAISILGVTLPPFSHDHHPTGSLAPQLFPLL